MQVNEGRKHTSRAWKHTSQSEKKDVDQSECENQALMDPRATEAGSPTTATRAQSQACWKYALEAIIFSCIHD